MTKIRSTKNALISAILVLCMCFTGLLGTTFAWFTDSVTSSGNKIVAGTLKVDLELLDKATGEWKSLKKDNDPIFVSEKWEPGHTEVKILKVENEGSLALSWKTVLTKYSEISELADVIDVYVLAYGVLDDAEASTVTYPQDRDLTGYTRVGTAAEFLRTMEATTKGFLEAEQSAYLGLALKMREDADNKYQGMSLGGTFDITVLATQGSFEEDSFDETYDKNADWPFYSINFTAAESVAGKVVNNTLTEEVPVGAADAQVSAVVPSGVKMADGAEALELSVKSMEAPTVDLNLEAGESAKSIDVHIDGVAEDNTTPMLVTLRQLFSKGLNSTSVKLYHVEDGTPVEMTQVALADLDAHNEFNYDPATGDVTMSVASFSEYTVVEDDFNLWEGTAKTDWYNDDDTEFTLTSAEQLAGLGIIVDGGYYTKDEAGEPVWTPFTYSDKTEYSDSFEGKTIKLGGDIDLGGTISFNPIGFKYPGAKDEAGNDIAKIFRGTFDGKNHVIRNLYQNGWELGLSYTNAGGGLFAGVQNATIKNLTMQGANIVMEAVPMGTVAAYAYGECTFDNIHITNSTLQNYNWDIAAIVGGVNGKHTFSNINIDSTVTLSSLWGSFGGGIGGVIGSVYGGYNGTNDIKMINVNVACVLDVYNDVTSAYQWYAYRFCGMLIGNTNEPGADGKNAYIAQASFLKCENVNVYYGDWVNYHYCQFTNQSDADGNSLWYNNYPWVRVEAGLSNPGYSNARYGHPIVKGEAVVDDNHDTCTGEHKMLLQFNQLYGGDQGVYGATTHDGVTTSSYAYTIQYINDNKVLAETYVESNASNYVLTSDPNYDTAKAAAEKWVTDQGYNVEFGGWVNAGSTKVTEIPKGTTGTVKLYPYFNSPYTARFVDQNGNVLAWCLFHSDKLGELESTRVAAEAALPNLGEHFEFDHWEVHITDEDGNTTTVEEYKSSNFANYATDVTVYPVYKFKGDVTLIPVDTDGDGTTNEYHVGGYNNPNGESMVEIPDYVNGLPITAINASAFSSYAGLHAIVIPKTVKTTGGTILATDWSDIWDAGETVTIYYEGSYKEWQEAEPNFDSEWEAGLGSGSRIFFLDGGDVVDTEEGYLEASVSGGSNKTISWNHNTKFTDDFIKQQKGYCDCSEPTEGDTAHIYVQENADGTITELGRNEEGTPINSSGTEIRWDVIKESWFGLSKEYGLTDGTNTNYKRYRPDVVFWEGVTAN